MKLHRIGIALALAAAPLAAMAANTADISKAIDPGEWAYSVHARMRLGQMDIPARTVSNKKCITQKDLDRSKDWVTNSRNGQCTMENMNFSGHVLTFTQKCSMGSGTLTVKGKMTIKSRTAYHGVFTTTGTIGGRDVEGHTTLDAHRTGDCQK